MTSTVKSHHTPPSDPGGSILGSADTSPFRRTGSLRGSMRKVLPSVPDMDTQLSMSAKMIDRRTCTPKGNHSYGPYFLEYSLLAEYNLLQKQKLPGVYIMPSAKSSLHWFGVLFIRTGQYQGGIFRFHVYIPDNYPDGDVPKLVFDPVVFHPLIDPRTGELDMHRGFQRWIRNVNHIWQVLLYARRVFFNIDIKSPVNTEAAALYEKDRELFKYKVAETIQQCQDHLYDPPPTDDPHYICFSRYNPEIHDATKKAMLNAKVIDENGKNGPPPNGLSFVRPGSLEPFSKSSSIT